jgi:hypothetical protein
VGREAVSLAQDIRNAYDWRDRDALERCLDQVKSLEVRNATHALPKQAQCSNPRGCVCAYTAADPRGCRYLNARA